MGACGVKKNSFRVGVAAIVISVSSAGVACLAGSVPPHEECPSGFHAVYEADGGYRCVVDHKPWWLRVVDAVRVVFSGGVA